MHIPWRSITLPYTNDLYDTFEDPELARKLAFKPFKLIDLTVLSDEEISQHGLAALMEMLFKHQRNKNFLSIMKKMLQDKIVQNVVKKLNVSYLTDMLNYIVNTSQDDNEPQAAQHLIQELIHAFPQEKEVIMTFAQQLKQEALQQGLQQGLQKGRREEDFIIAKKMLVKKLDLELIKEITGLSDQDLLNLKD